MALWKKNNFGIYADQIFSLLHKNFAHAIDNFVDDKFPAIKNGLMAWRPHVDLKETDKFYILKADIPGVDKKDLKVELCDDMLCISGERKEEAKHQKDKHHWTERFHGKFSRTFSLPSDLVEKNKIEAKFEEGVLTVTLKKKPQSKTKKESPSQHIEIK